MEHNVTLRAVKEVIDDTRSSRSVAAAYMISHTTLRIYYNTFFS